MSRVQSERVVIVMGVPESIDFLTFNHGVALGTSPLLMVTAFSGMGGAVAACYALFLLKEKLEKNQMLGIVLSLARVLTLLYFGG